MIEFIFEVMVQTIFKSVPKLIGIGTKWLFYIGKKPISQIRKENWNTRIGFLVLSIIFLLIIYKLNF
jgi:ascorbate-specific PTS system EIIC-type component UlaA